MSKYLPSSIYQLDYDSKYNARYKYLRKKDGSVVLCEEMYSKRYIFNPHHVEEHNKEARLHREAWDSQLDDWTLLYATSSSVLSLLRLIKLRLTEPTTTQLSKS